MGLTYIRSFPYDYFKLCNLLSPHSTSKIHITVVYTSSNMYLFKLKLNHTYLPFFFKGLKRGTSFPTKLVHMLGMYLRTVRFSYPDGQDA